METPSSARVRATYEGLFVVAVVGVGFQLFHFTEHLVQVVNWFGRPGGPPWLSRWAIIGSDSLAGLGDGARPTGAEFLHLFGNMIFLGGLVALSLYMRRSTRGSGRMKWLSIACIIQTLHVIEHAALTTTWVVGGEAIGVSTAFGALSGAALVNFRVWFHFAINLLGTAMTAAYLASVYADRRTTTARWTVRQPRVVESAGE